MMTRSMLQIMLEFAAVVQVPQPRQERGPGRYYTCQPVRAGLAASPANGRFRHNLSVAARGLLSIIVSSDTSDIRKGDFRH